MTGEKTFPLLRGAPQLHRERLWIENHHGITKQKAAAAPFHSCLMGWALWIWGQTPLVGVAMGVAVLVTCVRWLCLRADVDRCACPAGH